MPSAADKRKKAKLKAIISAPTTPSSATAAAAAAKEQEPHPKDQQRAWTSIDPPLSPWLLDALASMGFAKMTPVQASTIPLFLGNKDVVVEAVTGSGKTLAFLIPIIERILRSDAAPKKNHVAAVIVSPTRELAQQIHSVLLGLLEFHAASYALMLKAETDEDEGEDEGKDEDEDESMSPPPPLPSPPPPSADGRAIKPLLLLGGNTSSPAQDLMRFLEQSPDLLIGTPGRLNELLGSKHVHCSADSFEALVLDEADRLLDLGFKETLARIIVRLPKQRRTGLFSATVSDAVVGSLVRAGLRNPVKVAVKVRSGGGGAAHESEKRTPASLEMTYLLASPAQRLVYLQRILSPAAAPLFPADMVPQKTIIYFSNCASVDYFAPLFPAILAQGPEEEKGCRYSIVPLHGKQSASVRQRNFTKFSCAVSPTILLTTDLAARGLDVPEVDLVLQIDAPTDPKVFLHRCGRAGRAGRKGLAVLFLSPGREEGYLDFLSVRKTPVSLLSFPSSSSSSSSSSTLAAPPTPADIAPTVARMRATVLTDRALHEKALKAFVSHVRAHSKHQTASIFRVADLDWADLATSFALLKMPRMPELRKAKAGAGAGAGAVNVDLGLDREIDLHTLKYKDKTKEAARQVTLLAPKPDYAKSKDEREKKAKRNAAWSDKSSAKETKEERRGKKKRKREAERVAGMTGEEKMRDEEMREMVERVKREKLLVRDDEDEDEDEDEFRGFDGLD